LKRSVQRKVPIKYIEKCIKSIEPLGISKTMENRFMLIYPHETKSSEDVYIIIEIDDYQEIMVITTYTNTIQRRIREYAI